MVQVLAFQIRFQLSDRCRVLLSLVITVDVAQKLWKMESLRCFQDVSGNVDKVGVLLQHSVVAGQVSSKKNYSFKADISVLAYKTEKM